MAKKIYWQDELFRVAVLVILYTLIGNARSVEPNPFIPGAIVAVNMVIPVLAGVLFGARTGLLVGFFGALANALVLHTLNPQGNPQAHLSAEFELLAAAPHAAMGFLAGYLRRWLPTFILAGSLIVGHVLSIAFFLTVPPLLGQEPLVPFHVLMNSNLWYAILYETFIGIITVTVMTAVYRIGFENLKK